MSTPDANDTRLADRAEALLGEWPAPERSAIEWEDAASLVMNRVRETEIGSTPDELLGPPLAAEPDEPSLAIPEGDEPKLADIARAVVAEGALAANEIARDGLRAAEQGRREPSPSWNDPARTARGANAASLQGRVAQRPVTLQEARALSELPASRRDDNRPGFAAGLVGGAVIALAASAALYLSMRQHDADRLLAATSAETERAKEAVPTAQLAARATPATEATAASTAVPTMASAVALEDLPGPTAKADPRRESSAGAAKDSLAFRVQNAPKGKLVLEEQAGDELPAQAPAAQAASEPKPATAAQADTAGSDKGQEPQPSLGAVQAAVGSVMAGARSCLAGQEQGSKASITFGSDGRVKSVGISGPAAGTPAESCLRSALMSAQVPRFSDPTFSASLTIRPP